MMQVPSPDDGGDHDLSRVPPADLKQALRHHHRALTALAGRSFEGLSARTSQALIRRLRTTAGALETELRRREGAR